MILILIVATATAVNLGRPDAEPGEAPTAAGGSSSPSDGSPPRCLALDNHGLAPPDERNIRITGPSEPVAYPGYVQGRFDQLGTDDVVWILGYSHDADRYWPAEQAVTVDRRSGTWQMTDGFYLGNPNQPGKEFDVLIATVPGDSPIENRLTTMFDDDQPPFGGWSRLELSPELVLHDCARLTQK
jgi:hypothetical protein